MGDRISQMLADGKKVEISLGEIHKPRSLDANALLWSCIGDIALSLGADKWDIYLEMLKRYTKGIYLVVRPKAVESLKKQWRETEVIGEVEINGQKGVQCLCYRGSSHLDSKEFSVLLNGVISEMDEMDLPVQTQVRRIADAFEV